MMGPPGAGKGTQSQKIIDKYPAWKWISSGDLLRTQVKLKTPLGLQAQGYISSGKLVPDQLLSDMLVNELDQNDHTHVILDGYPRSLNQVQVLETSGYPVLAIFQFVISQPELTQRLAHRAVSEGRSDDTPEKIKVRLEIYEKEMKQVYAHYQKTTASNFCRLSAMGNVDAIAKRVLSFLRSRT